MSRLKLTLLSVSGGRQFYCGRGSQSSHQLDHASNEDTSAFVQIVESPRVAADDTLCDNRVCNETDVA